jgi:hypothetical protein
VRLAALAEDAGRRGFGLVARRAREELARR